MSRTYRNKRPRMKLGSLGDHQYKNGKVRDGTPQHVSSGCENHGSCPWCEGNRLHKNRRHEPIEEGTGL